MSRARPLKALDAFVGQVNRAFRAISARRPSIMYGALPSAFRSRLMRRMRSAPNGSLDEEAGLGRADRTPVAAYRYVLPYVARTVLPSMAATRYHVDPDFAVGHVVFQLPPETVPATVSVAFT